MVSHAELAYVLRRICFHLCALAAAPATCIVPRMLSVKTYPGTRFRSEAERAAKSCIYIHIYIYRERERDRERERERERKREREREPERER